MKTQEKSFDEVYEKILPDLQSVETIRKKRAEGIRKWRTFGFISLGLMVLVIFLELYVFLAIFLLFTLFCVGKDMENIHNAKQELRPQFKKVAIFGLLDYFFDDVSYIPNQRMSIKLLNKSLLVSQYIYKHFGEDFIECRMGKTDVCLSEIETYHLNNQNPTFKGVFIAVLFNKQFSTKTVIINRKNHTLFRKAKLNFFGDMQDAEYVKLENLEFNKNFIVIAENQIEARFKLTPALMEKMLDYKNKLNTAVSFSFIDKYLYISIESEVNLFEPRLFQSITEKEFIRTNYIHLDLLTSVVEDLDLNTRIWL